MRTAILLGRSCLRQSAHRIRLAVPRGHRWYHHRHDRHGADVITRVRSARPPPGAILLAALSPAAFVRLSEEEPTDGETSEERMLEASRAEMAKVLPDDLHGFTRFRRAVYLVLDRFVVEPLATGLRFLHLAFIFVPVIVSIPVIWLGGRVKDRDDEREGTLWWYGFLVSSMERAGPAFIKVSLPSASCCHADPATAGPVGRLAHGYLPHRDVLDHVGAPLQRAGALVGHDEADDRQSLRWTAV